VEIRPARPDEAVALRALVERAYGLYVNRIGRRPAPMDDDYAAKVDDRQLDVITEDGELVGLIVLIACDDHLLVENVAVDPRHQGRGAGRALMAHADRTAADLGLTEIRLYTHEAMTENLVLYPHLGYREIERRSEHGFKRVFFSKPVPPAS
jgi:ribosomal protein S18 acetylase RimI-like enzyme